MDSIFYNDYNLGMGILIDVRDKYEAIKNPIKYSKNIPFSDLIFNHSKYLNKNNKYYIICSKGNLSKRAVNILKVYGYNVTNVKR